MMAIENVKRSKKICGDIGKRGLWYEEKASERQNKQKI